jgi:hypothetical protein
VWILGDIIGDIAVNARKLPPFVAQGNDEEDLTVAEQVEARLKSASKKEADAERAKMSAAQERRGGDRYRNVLEEYMSDLSASGVAGRDQVQGMVLGEVESDSD